MHKYTWTKEFKPVFSISALIAELANHDMLQFLSDESTHKLILTLNLLYWKWTNMHWKEMEAINIKSPPPSNNFWVVMLWHCFIKESLTPWFYIHPSIPFWNLDDEIKIARIPNYMHDMYMCDAAVEYGERRIVCLWMFMYLEVYLSLRIRVLWFGFTEEDITSAAVWDILVVLCQQLVMS